MIAKTYPLTEGLRAGLDAAGIGWERPRVFGHDITVYRTGGTKWTVIECELLGGDGEMHHTLIAKTEPLLTVEQAIAATGVATAARHGGVPQKPLPEVGA